MKDDIKEKGCLLDGFPRAPDQAGGERRFGGAPFLVFHPPPPPHMVRGGSKSLCDFFGTSSGFLFRSWLTWRVTQCVLFLGRFPCQIDKGQTKGTPKPIGQANTTVVFQVFFLTHGPKRLSETNIPMGWTGGSRDWTTWAILAWRFVPRSFETQTGGLLKDRRFLHSSIRLIQTKKRTWSSNYLSHKSDQEPKIARASAPQAPGASHG